MSAGMVHLMRRICFRVTWFTMSDREKYAYLWNRTKSSHRHRGYCPGEGDIGLFAERLEIKRQ